MKTITRHTRSGPARPRRKKPDELLSSVIPKTANAAALDLFRENTAFTFPSGRTWVMITLAEQEIGGLSQRHRSDAAKGSIVELIEADSIETYADQRMFEREDELGGPFFGIIPTEGTITRMDEFSLLREATYQWGVVWQTEDEGVTFDLFGETSLRVVRDVIGGRTTLRDALGEEAWVRYSGQEDRATGTDDDERGEEQDEGTSAAEEDPDHDPVLAPLGMMDEEDEAPDDDPTPVFGSSAASNQDEDFLADSVLEDAPEESDDPSPGAIEGSGTDLHVEPEEIEDEAEGQGVEDVDPPVDGEVVEDDAEPVQLLDQDEARSLLARRFLSEDLELGISLEEFDLTFGIGLPNVAIDVPEGASEWLGDQVAQLGRQANADLSQLRSRHEDELRAMYVNLMSTHVEQVILEVAMDREGTRFTTLREGVERRHQERQEGKEERIRLRKKEIVEAHEEAAAQAGRQAAMHAEIQYKERHRPRVEREQVDAVAEIERVVDNDHDHDLGELHRLRRDAASLKMEVGRSRIFEVLAQKQSEHLDAEQELLTSWLEQSQRIIDDHRKADVSRVEALSEQQRVSTEIADMRAEHEERITAMRSEHEDRLKRLEVEFDQSRKEATTRMEARDEEWRHALAEEVERTSARDRRITDLTETIHSLNDAKDKEWGRRVEDLTAQKDRYAEQMKWAAMVQGRTNKALTAMVVLLSLLCLVAGYIAGSGLSG